MGIEPQRPDIAYPDRLFIGGQWVVPSTTDMFDIITPSTESALFSVAEGHDADIKLAVAAARESFDHGPWSSLSPAERADYLDALSREIARRAPEYANLWTGQVGIVHSVASASIPAAAGAFQYYANLARSFAFEQEHPSTTGGAVALMVREPVGTVAAIIPWNAPIFLIAYKVAPALAAGCTVVLKASPEAPGEAYLIAEAAEAIGLPKGVLNVVAADRSASRTLVRHPDIDKVSFTGSSAAGREIAATCGERIARYTLELGGKSAAVIMDDYDLGEAAQTLAEAACQINGQICAALSRVIVNRRRHDAFVEALAQEFSATRVGDPFDAATEMGPLAMARQRDRAERLIETAKREGATLATGGGRPRHLNRGFYIEPTVFGNVDNRLTIGTEEVFGPVLSVIAAEDEAQAVDIANDSIYGLNASVFTNDPERAYRASRRLRSGTVGHNGFHASFDLAFGGFKQSGVGREGGVEGLLSFLETKVITLADAAGRPS